MCGRQIAWSCSQSLALGFESMLTRSAWSLPTWRRVAAITNAIRDGLNSFGRNSIIHTRDVNEKAQVTQLDHIFQMVLTRSCLDFNVMDKVRSPNSKSSKFLSANDTGKL